MADLAMPTRASTRPGDPNPDEALRRVQDARDYAEAQAHRREALSNRDDAQLHGPKAGAR